MSHAVLVIGEPGSGKSTSLRNLVSRETFIINVIGKPLPFRGYKKRYKAITGWEDRENNLYNTDHFAKVLKCIDMVNKERPDIKNLIIDDWQYILANEFMARASEKGFDKFSEMAQHGSATLNAMRNTRPDLLTFVLAHSDADEFGKVKCKTIGKLLNEKVSVEGLFTTILHSLVIDDEHVFLTQNDGRHIARSPMGMFEDKYIPNDLAQVRQKIINYEEEE